MNEALKFLQDTPTFYIATVEGNEPKVRPFGFVMEFENKIYFITNKQKDIYKQLQVNPNFEISTTAKDMTWIRLKGKAVMDERLEVLQKAFEMAPFFANLYNTPENPILVSFYVADGEASICSMTGDKRTFAI